MKLSSKEKIDCFNVLREELKNRDIESVMRDNSWLKLMKLMADEINSASLGAKSESDIATQMDATILAFSQNVLEPVGKKGFKLEKEKKVSLKKAENYEGEMHVSTANGRIDSQYSSVIIEYKRPSVYKTNADVEKAFYQALDYLNAIYEEKLVHQENNSEKKDAGNLLGIVTDGLRCQFVIFNSEIKEIYDSDREKVNPDTQVDKLDGKALDRIIKSIISLRVKALTADNLIKDLVTTVKDGKNIIYHLTSSLYDSLHTMDAITKVSYGQWMNNFGLSHDDASKQKAIEDRRKDLAKIIDREKIETDEEYKILFALQTSIAVLAMLIAYKVVVVVKGDKEATFRDLLELDMEGRRIELNKIAEGATSIKMNIFNLLEMGCFSWPFQKNYWSEETNNFVKEIIAILMKYETMPYLTARADDLFRDLYMSIIPVSVRHSLGEYYTPDWLAENVIDSGLEYIPFDKAHIRILDSTAGSGTFPQKVIEKKIEKYSKENDSDILQYILNEVVAIDANTLAVILARINYFLAIANLIRPEDEVYIPVFIGDSSIPTSKKISPNGEYFIDTIQIGNGESISIEIPSKSIEKNKNFIANMRHLSFFGDADEETLNRQLNKLCNNEIELNEINESWQELREKGLITPAVINSMINSYLLCNIGKFDLIVGNPPWVDWKTLPSVHRENKKDTCYARNLFSGDGRTGGNSLNICALISNITAENWLSNDGIMAILMPQSLLFQQSYEGYRRFELYDKRKLYFQEIIDWAKSGHPFSPVQQLFCTYIISGTKQDYSKGIPLKKVQLKKGYKLDNIKNLICEKNFDDYFTIKKGVVGKADDDRSAFTYAKDREELEEFNKITGESIYIGREGVEYYPQELQLLNLLSYNEKKQTALLKTYQSKRSKIPVSQQTPKLETRYLRPLVKGINISRFHVDPSEFVVAFPYDKEHDQIPFSKEDLLEKAPKLLEYYENNKDYLKAQTAYSDKIIGKKEAPYYALARTGRYCHADWYVIFRDNTKWVSAVTGKINTEWGGDKTPAFQNHCVSICEKSDGSFITEEEAYYICAILNSHVVEDYILSTSDKRTFKIRIPVKIENFDSENEIHQKLVTLSKEAHKLYNDLESVEKIRTQIDKLYLKTLD